jgi:diguanylate cyclase
MDPVEFIAWHMQPGQWLGLLAVTWAAGTVNLLLARRSAMRPQRSGRLWVVGSALALGSGVWSGHFVALLGQQMPIQIGYGGWLSLAGWLLAVTTALLGVQMARRANAPLPRRLGAAVLMGVGAVGCEMLCFTDMKIVPAIVWHPLWLAASAGAVTAGAALAVEIMRRSGGDDAGRPVRMAAGLVLGIGVAVGHWASTRAAQFDIDAASLHHLTGLTGNALGLLATVGTTGLLASLSVLAAVERQLRLELRSAIKDLEATALTLEASARADALTSLPNRIAFEQQLAGIAHAADRSEASMALLYIALDDFKAVNDSFGRQIGDALLQGAAKRLEKLAGNLHPLARVGGDEFALLMGPSTDQVAATAMAQRIIKALAASTDIEGRHITTSCSIGVVMYPSHGAHSTMLGHGEAATRAAKRLGGGAPVIFEPQMLGNARDQLELLRDLREAIGSRQMELYYQPKIHAPSGAITGAEALLRWHHPKRGMVSPGVFIPIAERHGLIVDIGNWVIDEACRQARVWRDEGLRMRVAINLSVSQLRQPDMGARIAQALAKYQINPQLLTCEITESLAMEDSSTVTRFFEDIAHVGVHVSIDDFGTGYSSLSYLRKLPVQEVKIDRSFVLDLETSADARAVVDAVVKLAQALGLKVVAEGVENEAQSQILRGLGCDELQGFLFAKPMSAKALGVWAMTNDGPAPLKFRDSLFQETAPAPMH